MTKKKNLNQEDRETWEEFISSPTDIFDKEIDRTINNQRKKCICG